MDSLVINKHFNTYLCVFTFWVLCCDVRCDFRIKTMFGSSLSPVVCLTHYGVCFFLFFVLCTLCCQFLWIVLFWLPLRYSLMFIYYRSELFHLLHWFIMVYCRNHSILSDYNLQFVFWFEETNYSLLIELPNIHLSTLFIHGALSFQRARVIRNISSRPILKRRDSTVYCISAIVCLSTNKGVK